MKAKKVAVDMPHGGRPGSIVKELHTIPGIARPVVPVKLSSLSNSID